MHIPENYLSPSTCVVMAGATIPVLAYSVKKVKKEITKEKMPLLGIFAAFSFLAMMFNVPIPGGSTGHAIGGTLIAILLGPEAAFLALSITLIIQAFLFGDGGILAIGANCFNMAFVLPFVGYSFYNLITKNNKSKKAQYIGAGVGSYLGINAAALCAAIEFGLQPVLFKDASGNALYCPYGLNVSIPAMMASHLTIIGLVEVIFTVGVLAFINSTSPQSLKTEKNTKKTNTVIGIILAVLVIATPIGLIAEGDAWGEWDITDLSELVNYTPSGIKNGVFTKFSAIFPDYSMGSLPDWLGYILSAVAGISIVIIFFKIISTFMKNKVKYD